MSVETSEAHFRPLNNSRILLQPYKSESPRGLLAHVLVRQCTVGAVIEHQRSLSEALNMPISSHINILLHNTYTL
jgi:hypothetical protein